MLIHSWIKDNSIWLMPTASRLIKFVLLNDLHSLIQPALTKGSPRHTSSCGGQTHKASNGTEIAGGAPRVGCAACVELWQTPKQRYLYCSNVHMSQPCWLGAACSEDTGMERGHIHGVERGAAKIWLAPGWRSQAVFT